MIIYGGASYKQPISYRVFFSAVRFLDASSGWHHEGIDEWFHSSLLSPSLEQHLGFPRLERCSKVTKNVTEIISPVFHQSHNDCRKILVRVIFKIASDVIRDLASRPPNLFVKAMRLSQKRGCIPRAGKIS